MQTLICIIHTYIHICIYVYMFDTFISIYIHIYLYTYTYAIMCICVCRYEVMVQTLLKAKPRDDIGSLIYGHETTFEHNINGFNILKDEMTMASAQTHRTRGQELFLLLASTSKSDGRPAHADVQLKH